jgi:hypothetical protein
MSRNMFEWMMVPYLMLTKQASEWEARQATQNIWDRVWGKPTDSISEEIIDEELSLVRQGGVAQLVEENGSLQ